MARPFSGDGGAGPGGSRPGIPGRDEKRAGPWGGDGPARGGVSTITLREGWWAHRRATTTLRNHPATPRWSRNAGFMRVSWPVHSGIPGKSGRIRTDSQGLGHLGGSSASCPGSPRRATPSAKGGLDASATPTDGDHPAPRHRAAPSTARYRPRSFADANNLGLNLRDRPDRCEPRSITMWKPPANSGRTTVDAPACVRRTDAGSCARRTGPPSRSVRAARAAAARTPRP